MAVCEFMLEDDFAIKLSRLETDMQAVAEEAIAAGLGIVADEVKKNLKMVLSDEAPGGLADAMGITPIERDINGWNGKVGFDGYDKSQTSKKHPDGIAYQLKARVLESGTSTRRKKPFLRKSMNSSKLRVQEEMKKVIEKRTKEIFG